MASAEQRLAELGLQLPTPPAPAAAYQPTAVAGDLVFTAGQLPVVDGGLPRTGKLGAALDTAAGADLAATAALNVLAVARAAAGDLDRVRVVKLTVFVAATPDYAEHHLVADGASQRIADVLGEAGVHARSAVGVAGLPKDSPVEVEAVLQLL